ncbi:MAG TPA: Uma2 family endonuclease [Micromonosporaceae bacterium]|nr:Uma2 family endonuclease [Micromonosporaceae bacterium]
MTVALDFTPTDGWTTDDLDAIPDDGHRRELIDGVLHMPRSPSSYHQTVAGRLFARLDATRPDDMSANAGVEVRISTKRALIPDVLVVKATAAARRPAYFVPDDVLLVVEIVSPGSLTMDRVTKPALYGAAGIPLYWRIETEDGVAVTTYELDVDSGVYRATGEHRDTIRVARPWQIDIPIETLTRI